MSMTLLASGVLIKVGGQVGWGVYGQEGRGVSRVYGSRAGPAVTGPCQYLV